jgi:hypothetical protein
MTAHCFHGTFSIDSADESGAVQLAWNNPGPATISVESVLVMGVADGIPTLRLDRYSDPVVVSQGALLAQSAPATWACTDGGSASVSSVNTVADSTFTLPSDNTKTLSLLVHDADIGVAVPLPAGITIAGGSSVVIRTVETVGPRDVRVMIMWTEA